MGYEHIPMKTANQRTTRQPRAKVFSRKWPGSDCCVSTHYGMQQKCRFDSDKHVLFRGVSGILEVSQQFSPHLQWLGLFWKIFTFFTGNHGVKSIKHRAISCENGPISCGRGKAPGSAQPPRQCLQRPPVGCHPKRCWPGSDVTDTWHVGEDLTVDLLMKECNAQKYVQKKCWKIETYPMLMLVVICCGCAWFGCHPSIGRSTKIPADGLPLYPAVQFRFYTWYSICFYMSYTCSCTMNKSVDVV